MHHVAVEIHRFAETLAPELAVPVRHKFEAVGIRHHNGNVLALLFHSDVLKHRRHKRGILVGVGRVARLVHIRRASQKTDNVYAEHRRGKKSDGAKFAETAAHAVGYIIGFEALFLCEFDEIALALRSGCDDMFCPIVAASLFQNVGDDEILTHRFARRAALCDDVEHRLFNVDNVQKRKHTFGVYVVLDVEFHAALFGVEFVVSEMAKRVEHRHRAERASADTQNHKVLVMRSDFRRRVDNISYDFLLIVRKFRPTHPACAAVLLEVRVTVLRLVENGLYFFLGDALLADGRFHHIVEIKLDLHSVYASKMFLRYCTDSAISSTES